MSPPEWWCPRCQRDNQPTYRREEHICVDCGRAEQALQDFWHSRTGKRHMERLRKRLQEKRGTAA